MKNEREADHRPPVPLDEALRRSATPKPLAARPRVTVREIDEAASSLGISRSYVYRLLAAYRIRPRVSTLLPKTEGRKAGTCLVGPQTKLIIESAIDTFYLQRIKPPVSALVRQIKAECVQAGLKPPSRPTIQRRITALDERKIMAARLGAKAARGAI